MGRWGLLWAVFDEVHVAVGDAHHRHKGSHSDLSWLKRGQNSEIDCSHIREYTNVFT